MNGPELELRLEHVCLEQMLRLCLQGNVQSHRRAAERETESDEAAGPPQVEYEGIRAGPQGTPTPPHSLIPTLLLLPER